MALITCPDCSTQVSERAPTCPKCGAPIAGTAAAGPATRLPPGEEITYYADAAGVRVTNARVILGPKTFSMANISSVSVSRDQPSFVKPILLLALAGLCMSVGVNGSGQPPAWSVLALLAALVWGVALFFFRRDYWVLITGAGGDNKAWPGRDGVYIQRVVTAINEAIIGRG